MEALLTLAFDNISSRDTNKIRKGIRQIEGLLAQICLSKTTSRSPHKRKSSVLSTQPSPQQPSPKPRTDLRHDPAFREFFRLQEGFQHNVASHLLTTLETLLSLTPPTTQPTPTNTLIQSTLDLLQGILILHPPSRTLFARHTAMTLLLDLLDSASNPSATQCQTLLVLVAALLDNPGNTRVFEEMGGLQVVTSLFRDKGVGREVRVRGMEFVYFYLLPEVASGGSAPGTMVEGDGREKSEGAVRMVVEGLGGGQHARTHSGEMMGEGEGRGGTRSQAEKQRLLARFLPNVPEIAMDLKTSAPFGMAVAV